MAGCICVTGTEIGLMKRWQGSNAIRVFGVLAWMLADVQMSSDISDVHVKWFSHLKIRADNYDIMK